MVSTRQALKAQGVCDDKRYNFIIELRTTQKFIQQLQMQKSYFQLYPAKAYILQKIYQPCI